MAGVAIDGGVEVDLPDTLELADEEGGDGHQVAGMTGPNMAFSEP